jgi:hypothetical protein
MGFSSSLELGDGDPAATPDLDADRIVRTKRTFITIANSDFKPFSAGEVS